MKSFFKALGFSSNCYLCGCSTNSDENTPVADTSNHQTIESPLLCQYCHQRLPLSKNCCHSCGLPMFATDGQGQLCCGECLINSPLYDRVISAFHYEAPVSDFITRLKYSSQFQLLPLLSDYLIQKIQNSYQQVNWPTLIIAMPLHPKKLKSRGFNQSRLIANKLSQRLEIPLLKNGVVRIKNTQAQSGLDSVERKKNIKNAFEVRIPIAEHVTIVDDVVTTGMTASELTKQLLKNGAKKVDVWCIARAYDL